MNTVSVEIDLDESLAPLLDADGRQALRTQVLGLLEGMIEDLGIPAGVELSLKDPQQLGPPFRVSVDGKPALGPRASKPFQAATIRELALSLARVLDANRESLIGEAMAQAIRERWSSRDRRPCLPSLSRQDFRLYLQALVRRGFRLDRGADLGAPSQIGPEPWTPDECFEHAISSMANLRVILHHGSGGWPEPAAAALTSQLASMQEALFSEFGVRLPDILIREDPSLEAPEWRVQVNDLRLSPFRLETRELPVNEMRAWIQRHMGSLVVLETIEYELGRLATLSGDLIRITRARFQLTTLTRILRNLVDEGVSICNLRGVLEALLAVRTVINVDAGKYVVFTPYATVPYISGNPQPVDRLGAAELTECVRGQLKRYFSHKYAQGGNLLTVYLLETAIERRLADGRPLEPQEREALLGAIEAEIVSSAPPPKILTSIEVRRHLRRLIRVELPDLVVLSYQELSSDLKVRSISRISWGLS